MTGKLTKFQQLARRVEERYVGRDQVQKASRAGRPSPFTSPERKHDGAALVDVASLPAILDLVINAGDGVILSRTRDGGAICVQLLTGDMRHKVYAGEQLELDQVFADLFSAYKDGQMSM
jgi:hypothetical protein